MSSQSTASERSRAWVEVDLGALVRNGEELARHARVPLLPMVKADAYGLGVVPVVRALGKLDPFGYGVATVAEGAELRAAGVWRPVLVFTPLLLDDFVAARDAKLTPALGEPRAIAAWVESGGGPWHLAIDTGMNRAGIRWDAVRGVADVVRRAPPEGAFTHFHSAELDDGSLQEQDRRFEEALAALPGRPALLHTDNSAAIVRRSARIWSSRSFVRPGIFLYGVGSGPRAALRPEPVVRVCARLLELRELRPGDGVSYGSSWRAARPAVVATLGIGYADGYRRSLGNRGVALVHGRRAPVVGTVTMDMTIIDVTDIDCAIGDTVTLVGADGDQHVTVEEAADACDLSPYEILTGLRQRMPRRYA